MRIGIDASFLRKQHTGIGQVTANFLKKIGQTHQNAHEYILYLEEDVDFPLMGGVRKKVISCPWKRDDLVRAIWWQKYLLPKKVRQDECEIFLSLYQCSTIMPKDIKHIMIVHDVLLEIFPQYLNNWRKKFFWFLSKKAIKKADRIVAVSHRTEKDIVKYLKIDPAKITVNYIDVDEIYKKEVSNEESQRVLEKYNLKEKYIYYGGGLEMRKNVDGLMRVYKILLENYDAMMKIPQLVISGKMMPQLAPLITDVEILAEVLEIKDHVKLLGFVAQEDLPALYKNATLFIYPSLYEGFGLPVLEALNQGVPTVISKKSSLKEVGGDAVLYCDPNELDEMVQIIRKALNDEALRKELSEKGKKQAEKFSWDHFVRKIFNLIESMK